MKVAASISSLLVLCLSTASAFLPASKLSSPAAAAAAQITPLSFATITPIPKTVMASAAAPVTTSFVGSKLVRWVCRGGFGPRRPSLGSVRMAPLPQIGTNPD